MHFKYAKLDFSESILTPKNQSKLPKNYFLYHQLLLKTLVANFKFRGTLFSEIMPNFCSPHAMSVFKIQQNAFGTFIFSIKPS